MDVLEIRRNIVAALCSDDMLMSTLVLKGGNALAIAYHLPTRTSMDVDYSMSGDVADRALFQNRIERVLAARFRSLDIELIDFQMQDRPPLPQGVAMHPNWGGYACEFKLVSRKLFLEYGHDAHQLRMRALDVDIGSRKTLSIDISRHEYCDDRHTKEIDGLEFFVYSPELLCAEKLRAICQQFDEYPLRGHPAPRARDFYDIHVIITLLAVKLATPEFRSLLREVFLAKSVPLSFLWRLREAREFHRSDWPVVEITASHLAGDYDWYFDFVIAAVDQLQALGME
jgi:predicted nucleotidyltransferase component of viral defense system